MKSTTSGYKTIISSGNRRHYLIKIDLTLANNTVLHLTNADIWEDSFGIDTASSGTSSFDIGCAIIGKCTFTINNIDGDFDNYDFFNATAVVWLGLEGDITGSPATQQYYKMGTFTVDEPSIANGLISLTLLDYMWKFDRPLPNLTLPNSALTVINALCSHCGVVLGTQSFHGSSFSVPAIENMDDMNCRELLQYIVMIGCNFCTMNADGQLIIKWYNTSATSATTAVFDYNMSTSFGSEDIEITGIKTTINNTDYTRGSSGYVLEIENPLINENNVSTALNLMWEILHANSTNFTLRTFNMTTASDLCVEIGDKCKIRDYKGNYIYSWVTTNSFKTASHLLQCNAVSPNRTLVTRYSKNVQTAVAEARKNTAEQLSTYDQVVQLMNELAINAMGGYEDYEDVQTGGRIWYWSNMPITKSGGTCSFESGSVVFKKTGTGLFVSTNGGSTWGNAYDAQTGELVINMLYAIGLHADWIRTGTLLVGGSHTNPANADIQVYDQNDNLICTINKNGITMHQGIISSPDYAEVSGATYSTTGMKLDVLNKVLRSPYFAIDTNGAYFRGTIQITGDIEINRGQFRPTDYYLATDFRLQFQAREGYTGTSTAEIILHTFTMVSGEWVEDTTTIDTITMTDDEPELSVTLDHTVGQNGKDYYEIDVSSSSSITVMVKNANLAYVGREGFRGLLKGIFEGYLKTEVGEIAGFRYGQGTGGTYAGENGGFVDDSGYNFSMRDGFGRPNGALLKMYDNVFNFGNSDGHFRFFQADSTGGGSDSNSIGIQTGSNEISIIKFDSNYAVTGRVLWDSDIQTSDTDSPPQSLADGHLFLVYE